MIEIVTKSSIKVNAARVWLLAVLGLLAADRWSLPACYPSLLTSQD